MPVLNLLQAVNDALRVEMKRDPRVVADRGRAFPPSLVEQSSTSLPPSARYPRES